MSVDGTNLDTVNMVKREENVMQKKFVKMHHVKSCCLKRHPKQCKYYINYKQCKFDPSAFLHVGYTDKYEYFTSFKKNVLNNFSVLLLNTL